MKIHAITQGNNSDEEPDDFDLLYSGDEVCLTLRDQTHTLISVLYLNADQFNNLISIRQQQHMERK